MEKVKPLVLANIVVMVFLFIVGAVTAFLPILGTILLGMLVANVQENMREWSAKPSSLMGISTAAIGHLGIVYSIGGGAVVATVVGVILFSVWGGTRLYRKRRLYNEG